MNVFGNSNAGDSISLRLFDANGALVDSLTPALNPDYAIYSFSGLPVFRGLTIFDNNDDAGLRFQNISYNAVTDFSQRAVLAVGLLRL